ncbi:MAG: gamma-glutamyltransferase [Acidobacteria bacterium]|nr:gamma-glutamyltransferase [Acidobacteriota bacterium]
MRSLILGLMISLPLAAQGMVVSQDRLASEAGAQVLRQGGNAVDAAVATAFALAVTHPAAGNIGGGGFLVLREPGGETTTFDFRERAPGAARPGMFLRDGQPQDSLRHEGAASAGVPGSVAGLHLAWQRRGRLAWKALLAPAIHLAEHGFPVSPTLAGSLKVEWPKLSRHAGSRAQFGRSGEPYPAGERLVQVDLGRTLRRIAERGPRGFYEGPTAKALLREMRRGGGLITAADLKQYRAVERPALKGAYRGWEITAMGPPSSGGQVLIQGLNLLEGFDLETVAESTRIHLMAESLRRAYLDRARHLGDPDANPAMPLARLTDKAYAAELRRGIDPAKASSSAPAQVMEEPEHTTHLSVVDGEGRAVALTTTLEDSYGSRVLVRGAGFLLNNEMGDFNAAPGLTDATGLIGTSPNLARPGARMLSSMCPAILMKEGTLLILGSPGGRTIPSTVLGLAVGLVDLARDPQAAVDAPRFHHQWLPDRIQAEPGIPIEALQALGHIVKPVAKQGVAQVIRWRAGKAEGGADVKRWGDSAAVAQ